jgi:hypothetical protein
MLRQDTLNRLSPPKETELKLEEAEGDDQLDY